MGIHLVDMVITNGSIWTGDGDDDRVEAVAIRDGRIIAAGTSEELAPLAAGAARVIDLQGRFAMPGLNDSHIHAARAGLTWDQTLHWEDVRSSAEALATIAERVAQLRPGDWVSAVGGWGRRQFAEGRGPTREELDAVAPDNPVFLQELYDFGWLNSAALTALGWTDESTDPPGGTLMRDENGALTGEVRGMGAYAAPLAAALPADHDGAISGTRRMFDEFAAHGLTGVVDGGGFYVNPDSYRPLYEVWRARELTVRTRLFVSAWERGGEVANLSGFTSASLPELGDGMLQFSGIGEVVHYGCHDMEGLTPFNMSDPSYEDLVDIIRTAVASGWRVIVHAILDHTLSRVLDAFETVDRGTGVVGRLHCAIVHADEASRENLERISRLGLGVLVQNRLMLKGPDYEETWGEEAARRTPPIGMMRELGLTIGAGTDSTRANWFAPWPAIGWLVTGMALGTDVVRDPEHRMPVGDALRAYTSAAAWFTDEQGHRGRLAIGYDADICVPTADPFVIEPDELAFVRSDLTIMGGRVTHEAGELQDG